MSQASPVRGLTLACKVSILRILGVPVFVLVMVYYLRSLAVGDPQPQLRSLAGLIFLAVALTDAVDGYLARSRNEVTHLGKILDPIADKFLLLAALILLTRPGQPELQPQFPIWFTLLVISRDVFLIAGATVINWTCGHVDLRARWPGKTATALTMTAAMWALMNWPRGAFQVLVATAGLLTVVSWIRYLIDGARQFERAHHFLETHHD